MIDVRFCNYNMDYQQRLGFLKWLCRVGKGARGGPNEFLNRVRALYPDPERPRTPSSFESRNRLEPNKLLHTDEAPSWSVGFVPKRLDRLILWAEMVGLIAPSGRLSEWVTILEGLERNLNEKDLIEDNPFILSIEERAFFIQLLFYHDQVLPYLICHLAKLNTDAKIDVASSCIYIIQSLGDFLEQLRGNGLDEIRVRLELRDLLERIGRQYHLDDPRRIVNSETRADFVREFKAGKLKKVRVHLAEYHAVCRFEQLTDLGLLTKESPNHPANDLRTKEDVRTSWTWYVTPRLTTAAQIIAPQIANLESFLGESWISFCAAALGQKVKALDAFSDQRQIAAFLDDTLPLARRQIGPVQMHTWGCLSCLKAFRQGYLLELKTIERLLEAMRIDPHTSDAVRLSGRTELRGRTAAVPRTGLSELLKDHAIREGEPHGRN